MAAVSILSFEKYLPLTGSTRNSLWKLLNIVLIMPSSPLKAERTIINAAVPTAMPQKEILDMMLTMLKDFFDLQNLNAIHCIQYFFFTLIVLTPDLFFQYNPDCHLQKISIRVLYVPVCQCVSPVFFVFQAYIFVYL